MVEIVILEQIQQIIIILYENDEKNWLHDDYIMVIDDEMDEIEHYNEFDITDETDELEVIHETDEIDEYKLIHELLEIDELDDDEVEVVFDLVEMEVEYDYID